MDGQLLVLDLAEVRKNWGWFLVLGISLVVLGTIALGASPMVTIATVWVFGILLIAAGVSQFVQAFQVRGGSWLLLHLLVGAVDFVLGILMVTRPAILAVEITLLIGIFYLVGGLMRIVGAVVFRFPNWNWAVVSGVISVALGGLLVVEWPSSAMWFIGLCVGIQLLFHGWSWIMLALTARSLPATRGAPAAG